MINLFSCLRFQTGFSQRFAHQNKEVPAESAPTKVYEKKDLNEAVDTVGQLTQNIEKAEDKRNQLVEKIANMSRDDFIKAWSSYQLNAGAPVTYEAYQGFIDKLIAVAALELKDRLLTLLPPDHKLPPLRVELGQEEALSPEIDEKKYAKRFSMEARKRLHKAGIPPEKANAYKYEFDLDVIDFVQIYHLEPADVNPYAKFCNLSDDRLFFARDINALVRAHVKPEQTKVWVSSRFSGPDIAHLVKAGLTRAQADEYPFEYEGPHRTFSLNGLKISYLHAHGIRAESLKVKTVTDPSYYERLLADFEGSLRKEGYWKPGDPIKPLLPPLRE